MGAVTIMPTAVVLRRILVRHSYPILNAIVIMYFVGQLRGVSTGFGGDLKKRRGVYAETNQVLCSTGNYAVRYRSRRLATS
jgi:hypothetical protein